MENMENVSVERVVRELAAIGFARVTDYIRVTDGELTVTASDCLSQEQAAAIAAVERSSGGLKVKFYDKLKALELLGKALGLFDGAAAPQPENNLLEAIVAVTGEEVDLHGIPELQQAAADRHDLVESAGA